MEEKKVILREEEIGSQIDWGRFFGREAPLFLEIGIGNGEFIVWLAKKNPESNFIGVEVSKKYFKKAVNRVIREGLQNVKLMHIEGAKFMAKFLKRESLSGIYINFPDPWVKKKHQKRRLISLPFIWLVADRLTLGGFFLMVTDCQEYANEVVELFSECPAFSPLWDTPIKKELPEYYLTKYARKWLACGLPIFYIGFKKCKRVEIPEWVYKIFPLIKVSEEEKTLPEMIVEIEEGIDFFELAKKFPKGILYKGENEVIKVLDTYSKEDGMLIDTLVVEGTLRQRFFIAVNTYHKKGLIISLHDSEKPDITDGVHKAVAMVILEIKKFFEKFRIVKTTCKKKILNLLQDLEKKDKIL